MSRLGGRRNTRHENSRAYIDSVGADNDKKCGNISSARVDDDPLRLTSLGDESAKPLALEKGIGDSLVDEGTEAPMAHLHLPPVKVRMLTSAAGGLLLTGTAATTLRTVFPPPPLAWISVKWLRRGTTNTSTTTRETDFDQLAPSFHRKLIETELRQNIWRLIMADVQVVDAAAHFWEGGARCFVGDSFGAL